jgi:hypothetical protein
MTQRERSMAGCIVGALVLFGGYKVVQSKVVAPRRELIANIAKQRERHDKLRMRLNGADKIVQAWRKQTARTLGPDPFRAHQAFREDVAMLLDRNNLIGAQAGDQGKVTKDKERHRKEWWREGFVELPLKVHAEGTLPDLVNFLRDLYQRPYVVRVETLSLRPDLGRKGKQGSTEPRLTIDMTLTTLVLPELADLEHPTVDPEALNNPENEVELASALHLSEEDPVAYNEIARVNFFKIYEPPPRVVQKPPEEKPAETKLVDKPPPPPPVDPRRDAHKFKLEGMGHLDDGPVAYVTNVDQPGQPPDAYRLNDDVDDGQLVLIVSEGIVVRVAPAGGSRLPPEYYFYPLGSTFAEREEVKADEHPEITRLLQLVLRR